MRPAVLMALGLLTVWPPLAAAAGDDPPAAGELLDEVVAVVNRHVITRSELLEEAWLVLVDRRGQAGLERELTPDFLRQVLDLLINQAVLLDEARRVELPAVSDQERESLLLGFRGRFLDGEAYLRFLLRYGLGEPEVAEVLVRHLRVARLKEARLQALPDVTPEAVAEFYAANRDNFGGAPLATVADAIRHRLGAAARERELARWVWELRKRAEVKVLVELGDPDEAGAGVEAGERGDDAL
jgi:hypothetical protein